ncbi:1-acyl-sn-glycerol-3-phosphate acyltransferase [Myxococcota bacterium]|nr:1-acyl-sn-glycerol-3-phosphate acyltransferase [Myxococcota bacterium]MBU1897397.1 1-acyl-sn-glycerol-3-phosphate acyltransferase [Myxococcota bacterium]
MKRRLFSLWIWSIVAAHSALLLALSLLIIAALAPLWDRRRRLFMALERLWAYPLTRLDHFYSVRLCGLERLGPGPYVIIANHASILDLLLIFRLPLPLRVVIKRELLRSPLGLHLWLGGHIIADRARRQEHARILHEAEAWLRLGISVVIFPEGRRSRDGRLGRLRRGAFELACRAQVPVLPLAIQGTAAAAPPGGGFEPGPHQVSLTALPPLPAIGLDPHALRAQARAALSAALGAP